MRDRYTWRLGRAVVYRTKNGIGDVAGVITRITPKTFWVTLFDDTCKYRRDTGKVLNIMDGEDLVRPVFPSDPEVVRRKADELICDWLLLRWYGDFSKVRQKLSTSALRKISVIVIREIGWVSI